MSHNPQAEPADPAGTLPHVPNAAPSTDGSKLNDTFPHAPAAIAEFPAELAARYTLREVLGEGGMGRVFLVEDSTLGRPVALKQLHERLSGSTAAERFRREARITGRLQHRGIVPVYDLIELPGGRTFYTMKPLRGRTLSRAIDAFHEHLPVRPAESREFRTLLRAFVDLCRTMNYVHHSGVIHRDLKGANVQVDDFGEVVVLDWGVAKVVGEEEQGAASANASEEESGTQAGQVIGTPLYMSPEQARGDLAQLSPRSDIYSLGAILLSLLTNSPPVERGKNQVETLQNVIDGRIRSPRTRAPWVPAALEAVCLKALATNPEDRYASAGALADDVQHYLDDEAITARRAPLAERFARWTRRNRLLVRSVFVGGVLAILALAAIAVVVYLDGIKIDGERLKAVQAADIAKQREKDAQDASVREAIKAEEAKAASALATKNAEEAKTASELATKRAAEAQEALRQSLLAIDEALVKLAADRFRLLPGVQPINKELLERAAAGCEALLKLSPNSPAVIGQVGKVQLHLAEVAVELEGEAVGIRHLEEALAFQTRRVAAVPDDLDAQIDRGYVQFLLGVRRGRSGDRVTAAKMFNEALVEQQRLVADPRVQANTQLKARCDCNLGRTLLQVAKWQTDNQPVKKQVFELMTAAISRLESAYDLEKTRVEYAHQLAAGLVESGLLARAYREPALARRILGTARLVIEELPADVQRESRIQQQLGNAYNIAHLVEVEDGKKAEGRAFLEKAIEIRTRLMRTNPAVLTYKGETASVLTSLATSERRESNLDRSIELYTRSLALYDEIGLVDSSLPIFRNARNTTAFSLGDTLALAKRWAEAGQVFDKMRPDLLSSYDCALVGIGLTRCAKGIRGTNETLTGQAERDWRLCADAAVACLRDAKKRGDKRTGAELQKLAPLDSLRGASGYAELLKEWGVEAPKE